VPAIDETCALHRFFFFAVEHGPRQGGGKPTEPAPWCPRSTTPVQRTGLYFLPEAQPRGAALAGRQSRLRDARERI